MQRKTRIYLGVALIVVITAGMIVGLAANRITPLGRINILQPKPACVVPRMVSSQDQNRNGVPDSLDIVRGGREEVMRETIYDASYYQGYPPEGRGACTDVIWRAFAAAGYDLKEMVDDDIRQSPAAYGQTGLHPDPNIDFRRVGNLQVFFARHAQELTTRISPGDVDNLADWQPGDIVIFGGRLEHIGVISDRSRRDGVPLMIHNCGPKASEDQYYLTNWPTPITHHFRFFSLDIVHPI
ncbi:MAG: DUF1287 domain-containing protein [Syntrophomonadaceae bacterium]